jgi:hypothetical protein
MAAGRQRKMVNTMKADEDKEEEEGGGGGKEPARTADVV